MEAGTEALVTVANHWLSRFEAALGARDAAALQGLFARESYWRDVLALTWRIQTVGSPADHLSKIGPAASGFGAVTVGVACRLGASGALRMDCRSTAGIGSPRSCNTPLASSL